MNSKKIALIENIVSLISGFAFLALSIVLFCLNEKTVNSYGSAVACLSICIVLLLIPTKALLSLGKKQDMRSSLDERQIQIHLIAFVIAFFSLTLYISIIAILDFSLSISFAPFFVEFLYGLVATGLFIICFAIWKDSFLNVNSKKELWSFLAVYIAIGISNLSLGISDIPNMLVENQLTAASMYFVTTLFNFVVALNLILKDVSSIKQNDEEQ